MSYLFLMLGSPGSGKSFVSEWLAPKMQAVHMRSDDLRLYMFGKDRPELHENKRYILPVIGAMEYMGRQVLSAGHSVIYDANMNRRTTRSKLARLATEYGAQAIVVWVHVPLELARQRVVRRAETGGHEYFGLDFIERMTKNIEPPTDGEQVIELDGTGSAEQQQASFDQQFADIARRTVQ